MAVTIAQIAEAAGVSRPTVSLVLNGKGERYSDKTIAKVLATAKRLGYRPNAFARAIRKGQFNSLVLLHDPSGTNSYLPQALLRGIHIAIEAQGLYLGMAEIPDDKMMERDLAPKIMRETMADGLLLNYHAALPEALREQLQQNHVPFVWINNKLPENAVYPDEEGAAVKLTETLLEAGHSRIAYVDTSYHHQMSAARHYSRTDRLAGYRRAMQAAGLPADVYLDDDHPYREADNTAVVRRLLLAEERPTAIITAIQHVAERIAHAVPFALPPAAPRPDLGTFADHPRGEASCRLFLMLAPWPEVGETAVEMLLTRIGAAVDCPSRAVAASLAADLRLRPHRV